MLIFMVGTQRSGQQLCKFLGYRYMPSMLNVHKPTAKSNDLLGNVVNSVMNE